MSNVEEQLEQIEISDKQAKEMVSKMESLLRLVKNRDFKKVIEEGYFEKEASRIVLLKGDPEMQSEADQRTLDNMIIAVGGLRQYLSSTMQIGRMAQRDLAANAEAREEMLAETL